MGNVIADEIIIKPAREKLDYSDLVLIQHYRRSKDDEGTSLENQQEDTERIMEELGIPIHHEFLIKVAQHTTEGYERPDLIKVKHFFEVGALINGKIVKANGLICNKLNRSFGRDEKPEYDVFGMSLETYMRDNNLELFERYRRFNLRDQRDLRDIINRKADAKSGGIEIINDTKWGKFTCAITQGRPISLAPWLWDWDEETFKEGGRKITRITYSLLPERVEIFLKIKELMKTRKYGGDRMIAREMNRLGYTWTDVRVHPKKMKVHPITQHRVANLLSRKVFYNGVWDDRVSFENPSTGEVKKNAPHLPMELNGTPISGGLAEWQEIQDIRKDNGTHNGEPKYHWLGDSIAKCGVCNGRLKLYSESRKNKKTLLYYYCRKCGIYFPKEEFENSILIVHDTIFKDPGEIEKLIKGNPAEDRLMDQRLQELYRMQATNLNEQNNLKNNLLEEGKKGPLPPAVLELFKGEVSLLADEQLQVETEIGEIKAKMKYRSEVLDPSINKVLAMAIAFRGRFGLKDQKFDFQQKFLQTLYPRGHKDFCIRVWKTDKKQFRWSSHGVLTDSDMEGIFGKVSVSERRNIKAEVPRRSPWFRVVRKVLGREHTDEEMKLLYQHGFVNKSDWYKLDIKHLKKVLKIHGDDLPGHDRATTGGCPYDYPFFFVCFVLLSL